MNWHIRRMRNPDVEEIMQLSLLAWEPVFASFEQILGSEIYPIVYPDWRGSQRKAIEDVCREPENTLVWVAEREEQVVGFVAYELNHTEEKGEVQLLAVHPDHQNLGIGTALSDFALQKMIEAGMKLAIVRTGGDPSHAPARRAYEKSGYTGIPSVIYFKKL
ncbi:MAG TPA: GNAT family N-acetyltransferase [Chthonomonadaceae bacterium]|nr:GNAT family N-acetyltransferase [Chthonomonadaceae bacterium]